jgi:hypothetical protein
MQKLNDIINEGVSRHEIVSQFIDGKLVFPSDLSYGYQLNDPRVADLFRKLVDLLEKEGLSRGEVGGFRSDGDWWEDYRIQPYSKRTLHFVIEVSADYDAITKDGKKLR